MALRISRCQPAESQLGQGLAVLGRPGCWFRNREEAIDAHAGTNFGVCGKTA